MVCSVQKHGGPVWSLQYVDSVDWVQRCKGGEKKVDGTSRASSADPTPIPFQPLDRESTRKLIPSPRLTLTECREAAAKPGGYTRKVCGRMGRDVVMGVCLIETVLSETASSEVVRGSLGKEHRLCVLGS